MTNKVKPFFIRITDDITPQMVQDVFDKYADFNVDAVGNIHNWSYIGLRENGIVHVSMFEACFHGVEEITIDQLDAHLGVDEWKNGDDCEYKDEDDEWSAGGRYVCYDDFASHHVFYATNMTLYHATSDQLRKPETPEQKAERERLEAIETMCNEVDKLPHGEAFAAMATLYDLGYRKQ